MPFGCHSYNGRSLLLFHELLITAGATPATAQERLQRTQDILLGKRSSEDLILVQQVCEGPLSPSSLISVPKTVAGGVYPLW